MAHATSFPPRSAEERDLFLNVIQGSLGVRRHFDLLRWLQSDLQFFLPHDILLASWGDYTTGVVYLDVLSQLPGMRTGPEIAGDVTAFLQRLFGRWKDHGCAPFRLNVPEGFSLGGKTSADSIGQSFRQMRSAIAHGIKDERGQHDCLYVAFSADDTIHPPAPSYIKVLLPHIETALRQVLHLPEQRGDTEGADPLGEYGLSDREVEIMKWVRAGKTNQEIGLILDISAFTVKNHLQRIFRKLDVTNRAQAVDKAAQKPKYARS